MFANVIIKKTYFIVFVDPNNAQYNFSIKVNSIKCILARNLAFKIFFFATSITVFNVRLLMKTARSATHFISWKI
jgi:hypothetical protein